MIDKENREERVLNEVRKLKPIKLMNSTELNPMFKYFLKFYEQREPKLKRVKLPSESFVVCFNHSQFKVLSKMMGRANKAEYGLMPNSRISWKFRTGFVLNILDNEDKLNCLIVLDDTKIKSEGELILKIAHEFLHYCEGYLKLNGGDLANKLLSSITIQTMKEDLPSFQIPSDFLTLFKT